MRRQFKLAEEDEDCLKASGYEWETIVEGDVKWLIILSYAIVAGYNVATARAALRMPPKYPDEQIDMVYFNPPLTLQSGRGIGALSLTMIDNAQFQQWSRHRTGANPWRPGLDNVCTHLLQVRTWLQREVQKAAA